MVIVPFDDLESAFYWVSGAAPFECSAYISKVSGEVFFGSNSRELDEDLPEDYEGASLYWTVPHKNDLNLGRSLAFDFAEECIPDHFKNVQRIFNQRGAYREFKFLLDQLGLLQEWYDYERKSIEAGLLAWAKRAGMNVAPPVPKNAA